MLAWVVRPLHDVHDLFAAASHEAATAFHYNKSEVALIDQQVIGPKI